MKRREFFALLGGAAAVWPLVARAQEAGSKHTVGILSASGTRNRVPIAALSELGWVEKGKEVVFEHRYADNRLERLPGLAADLVRSRSMSLRQPGLSHR